MILALSLSSRARDKCPRKKQSVASYRIMLGFGSECNSRELKFNNHVYLFLFYQRRNVQEINRQLLGTGHTWGWLRNTKAGSRCSAMIYTIYFQQSKNYPRKKPSVGNYKICLGFAVECNSRELKFNNNVYLFIFYESEQFPRNKQSVAN